MQVLVNLKKVDSNFPHFSMELYNMYYTRELFGFRFIYCDVHWRAIVEGLSL